MNVLKWFRNRNRTILSNRVRKQYRCGKNRNWGGRLFKGNRVVHACNNKCCKGCKYEYKCPYVCSFRHNCMDKISSTGIINNIKNRLKGRGM